MTPPNLLDWPEVACEKSADNARRVNLDTLTRDAMADWKKAETLLLSGKMLTGRDAAHKGPEDMKSTAQDLPISLKGRVIYYVSPVDPVEGEAVLPADPTTSIRMDGFTDKMLNEGLLSMVGKAERGQETIDKIVANKATYLIAVGSVAVLVSKGHP
jgi:fumarate hydratase class I